MFGTKWYIRESCALLGLRRAHRGDSAALLRWGLNEDERATPSWLFRESLVPDWRYVPVPGARTKCEITPSRVLDCTWKCTQAKDHSGVLIYRLRTNWPEYSSSTGIDHERNRLLAEDALSSVGSRWLTVWTEVLSRGLSMGLSIGVLRDSMRDEGKLCEEAYGGGREDWKELF